MNEDKKTPPPEVRIPKGGIEKQSYKLYHRLRLMSTAWKVKEK